LASKIIMQATSRVMVVSSGNTCSLEDVPEEINPEDMIKGSPRNSQTRQSQEIKRYRIQSDIREATEAEKDAKMTERMKNECTGKTVVVSTVTTINVEEYINQSRFDIYNNNVEEYINQSRFDIYNLKTIGHDARQGCDNTYYGCQILTPSNCYRWVYRGFGSTVAEGGNQPLNLHYLGSENYCVRCCEQTGTGLFPCSCINSQRAFSTAYAISRNSNFFGYDCVKRSSYCNWDPNDQVPGCDYANVGSCINDGSCPYPNCATQQECNNSG